MVGENGWRQVARTDNKRDLIELRIVNSDRTSDVEVKELTKGLWSITFKLDADLGMFLERNCHLFVTNRGRVEWATCREFGCTKRDEKRSAKNEHRKLFGRIAAFNFAN